MTLLEQAAPDFADHMIDACSGAEAGFHFEEGGCWGMALALHDHLTVLGQAPALVVMTNFAHAMVSVDGQFLDHQGIAHVNPADTRQVTEEELLALAEQGGFSRDEIEGDRQQAAEIIEYAQELADA